MSIPRQPPLDAADKQALRDVLEPEHPQDRDVLALLDEIETLHGVVGALEDRLTVRETELADIMADANDFMVALAVALDTAQAAIEITLADAERVKRHRLVKVRAGDRVVFTLKAFDA